MKSAKIWNNILGQLVVVLITYLPPVMYVVLLEHMEIIWPIPFIVLLPF